MAIIFAVVIANWSTSSTASGAATSYPKLRTFASAASVVRPHWYDYLETTRLARDRIDNGTDYFQPRACWRVQ